MSRRDLAMLQIKNPEECKLHACAEGCGDVGSRGCRRCRGRLYDYGGGGGGLSCRFTEGRLARGR